MKDFILAIDMNRFICLIFSLILIPSAVSFAGEPEKHEEKVKFEYDVDFEMNFDNREFYRSGFSESMTIFGARLTPAAGLSFQQPEHGLKHRIMLGIDVMKDFGASPVSEGLAGVGSDETAVGLVNKALFREITVYYQLDKKSGNTGLELLAGVFPRRFTEGNYSEAFFSDSLRFYDNNLEGLLVKIRRPRSYWEVGCDWLGMKGYARKEKFMIFSSGESRVTESFAVGYSGYMYHFAGSGKARGVVDNILLNPYVRLDLARQTGLQRFSVRLGWLQAMQHDRVFVGHYVFPGGGELDLDIRKWNVGIRNHVFYGMDMMPYYNSTDAAGDKYGSRLYFGDPFYRIHDDGVSDAGLYDRLDVYYELYPGNRLSVRIAARFHFNGFRYSGCQQVVSLKFSI